MTSSGWIRSIISNAFDLNKKQIEKKLKQNIPNKILYVAEALRKKINIIKIQKLTKIDLWFLEQIKEIIDTENQIKKEGLPKNHNEFNRIKSKGFTDKKLSEITNISEEIVKDSKVNYEIDELNSKFKAINVAPAVTKWGAG